MGTPQPAMHRTVLAVDVEAFSAQHRIQHHEIIRKGLYESLRNAFAESDIPWVEEDHEDRGDGLLVLLPVEVPKSRVVNRLPHALAGELRRHNAAHDKDAEVRLRVAVNAGEVRKDEHGMVADAINLTARLLDAPPLKSELAHSPGVLALIVSDRFYDEVIRDDAASNPPAYRRVRVDVKETHAKAWISLPDNPRLATPKPTHEPPAHRHRAARRPTVPRPKATTLLLVALLVGLLLTDGLVAAPPPVPPCPDPIQLNVLTTAEQGGLVRRVAVGFEQASKGVDEQGCKQVNVQVAVASSRDMVDPLGRGWSAPDDVTRNGPEPHVWLPDSTLEVERVNALLETNHRGTTVGLTNRGSVAQTPLVLGASPAIVTRLGRPNAEFRWRDLLGPVALAREAPESSAAGLAATAGLYQAELDTTVLDQAALTRPEAPRELHEVERRTTSEPVECGPGDVALLASEASVVKHNGNCPQHPLSVLYPEEGTLFLDHPFVSITWRHRPVNNRRQRMVDRFLEHLRAPLTQDEFKQDGFRDVDWNTGHFTWPRAGRPRELTMTLDTAALLGASAAASRRTRMRLAVDPSVAADAADFTARLTRLVGGGRDELRPAEFTGGLSATARAAIDRLRAEADEDTPTSDSVIVVTSGSGGANTEVADLGDGRPVRVHAVTFTAGACQAAASELRALTDGTDGTCQEITGPADVGRVLDGVATGLWGGGPR